MDQAITHLGNNDTVMAKLVVQFGRCDITPHKNYYQELVDSIISQQLSVRAARTIEARFRNLFDRKNFPSPEQILEIDVEAMRSAGLSYSKAKYIKDLAQHVIDGRVKFNHLDGLSNEEIVDELTAVKGIGVWTVHMFLIFCMGRLDVLAHGDLGIRNGIQKLYNYDHLPGSDEISALADIKSWHPYESVACWYIWKSLDNAPKTNL